MKYTITFISIVSISLLTACGGGGDGGKSNPVAAVPASSEDIVAQRDFSFDIGKKITLSVNYAGATKGALHIYSEAAFTKDNGEVIAEPTSRMTTIYPDLTDVVELEVNGNWPNLYVRWVPMSSAESEQSWSIALDEPSNSYHLAF